MEKEKRVKKKKKKQIRSTCFHTYRKFYRQSLSSYYLAMVRPAPRNVVLFALTPNGTPELLVNIIQSEPPYRKKYIFLLPALSISYRVTGPLLVSQTIIDLLREYQTSNPSLVERYHRSKLTVTSNLGPGLVLVLSWDLASDLVLRLLRCSQYNFERTKPCIVLRSVA